MQGTCRRQHSVAGAGPVTCCCAPLIFLFCTHSHLHQQGLSYRSHLRHHPHSHLVGQLEHVITDMTPAKLARSQAPHLRGGFDAPVASVPACQTSALSRQHAHSSGAPSPGSRAMYVRMPVLIVARHKWGEPYAATRGAGRGRLPSQLQDSHAQERVRVEDVRHTLLLGKCLSSSSKLTHHATGHLRPWRRRQWGPQPAIAAGASKATCCCLVSKLDFQQTVPII